MYGLTRGTITLIAAGVAGLLIWLATQISNDHTGGYWARIGIVAGAGLVMALSQLLGGWTKWGWPHLSFAVLLTAFVPVALVSLWVILAAEPSSGWFHNHVLNWSGDISVDGLVNDLLVYVPLLAFGTGLVFGFSFDTAGPRVAAEPDPVVVDDRPPVDDTVADEPLTADRREVVTEPEPTDATLDDRERITTTTRRTED